MPRVGTLDMTHKEEINFMIYILLMFREINLMLSRKPTVYPENRMLLILKGALNGSPVPCNNHLLYI